MISDFVSPICNTRLVKGFCNSTEGGLGGSRWRRLRGAWSVGFPGHVPIAGAGCGSSCPWWFSDPVPADLCSVVSYAFIRSCKIGYKRPITLYPMALPLDTLTVSEAAALTTDGIDKLTKSVSRCSYQILLDV